ncbi:A/G-specific DNA-adenine glycosylase [Syntrophus gentianae]|uniref:Adenine DNA glycosylase n=1 Tax=Syntrophus gentianae TaxID=43775 RepID=A0A1H7VNJ9_9BACT|nr:A/G-specific adenine glycosylase [Syntrophus gentianae]SEM10387.1 A/G-specific DNA-adenine glycosylase [Syntrophus gentianae]
MDDRQGSLEWAEQKAKEIATLLLFWYEKNKRLLPWRTTADPYAIWLSEIMLQQTQVDAVIPYYRRFLEQFPTIRDLARAPLEAVLKAWENMGYYSRARHLHAAARLVVDSHGGQLPQDPDDLKALPGIGPYTAGAILSIAFGKPVPAVDGNVKRVLSRLFAVDRPLNDGSTQRYISLLAEKLVPAENAGLFNSALMELGALLCRPGMPTCSACPLTSICLAYAGNSQHQLPVAGKRAKRPHKEAAAVILRDSGNRLLIVQRPADGFLGGLWKFPGGMVNPGETVSEGLKNRCREELNLSVSVREPLLTLQQGYTHFQLTLHVFSGTILEGNPGLPATGNWLWASVGDIRRFPFSRAELRILEALFP